MTTGRRDERPERLVPEAREAAEPGPVADAAAIASDDALLTALAGAPVGALTWDDQPLAPTGPAPVGPAELDDPHDRVAALLAALRADIDSELPAERTGLAPVLPLSGSARRRVTRLVPRTAAAATATALVLSIGGVAAAAVGAGPQSWLYPLHRVLVTGQAPDASQRAAAEVRSALDTARTGLDAGQLAGVRPALDLAARLLGLVTPADGRADLAATLAGLRGRLDAALAALAPALPATGGADPLPSLPGHPSADPSTHPGDGSRAGAHRHGPGGASGANGHGAGHGRAHGGAHGGATGTGAGAGHRSDHPSGHHGGGGSGHTGMTPPSSSAGHGHAGGSGGTDHSGGTGRSSAHAPGARLTASPAPRHG